MTKMRDRPPHPRNTKEAKQRIHVTNGRDGITLTAPGVPHAFLSWEELEQMRGLSGWKRTPSATAHRRPADRQ